MSKIETIEQLESIYGFPQETSTVKVTSTVIPEYRAYIEASPFAALATVGPEGLDCSPRGDQPGFVRVVDETRLQMPDRRGNNRIDSLRNIVRDSRVALLFFFPGHGTTLRVNGNASLSADAELLGSFEVDGKQPRTVIEIVVSEVYFQCARAIVRSGIWDSSSHVDRESLPTPGQILEKLSGKRIDGTKYDHEWPERASKTMW
jgi:PPOX class probable FMN-dependent enzyme